MIRPIFPPRPKGKTMPGTLPRYSNDPRWAAQRKFNGQRVVIYLSADRTQLTMYDRHAVLPAYRPTSSVIADFKKLNLEDGKDYWFDGELMNAKTVTPHYKNRIILFDVLHAGKYLFGKSQAERLQMLDAISRHPTQREPGHGIALVVSEHIWMAETFTTDFPVRFREFIHLDEIEGLVLKKLDSVLDNVGLIEYEIPWQIRCRKPHKNYNH